MLNGVCYEGLWAAGMDLFVEHIVVFVFFVLFYYLANWIDWRLLTLFCKTENSHQPLTSPQEKAKACGLLGAVCGGLVSRVGGHSECHD